MVKEKEFPVYGDNGFRGTLLAAARFLDPSPEKRIRLEDGREIKVPSSALVAQPDGSYFLKTAEPAVSQQASPEPSLAEPAVLQPPVPEAAAPTPASPPEPRRIVTPSATEALYREDCDVERVPIKRILDKPAEVRQEGDTLIIPLMEEVLVVEKRLMLREELHIRRRRENKTDTDRTPIPLEELPR